MNLVERDGAFLKVNWFDRGDVGRKIALVVEGHLTVALEVHAAKVAVLIHWKLLIVGPDSVSMGVGVREQARLQHWVGGWLDAWDEVGRIESSKLNLREVVLDVSIQRKLSELAEREVLVGPDCALLSELSSTEGSR